LLIAQVEVKLNLLIEVKKSKTVYLTNQMFLFPLFTNKRKDMSKFCIFAHTYEN